MLGSDRVLREEKGEGSCRNGSGVGWISATATFTNAAEAILQLEHEDKGREHQTAKGSGAEEGRAVFGLQGGILIWLGGCCTYSRFS